MQLVEEHAVLADGINYLKRRGREVHFKVALGAHTTAADLGPAGWFEKEAAAADYYVYEGLNNTMYDAQQQRVIRAMLRWDVFPSPDTFTPSNVREFLQSNNLGADDFNTRLESVLYCRERPSASNDLSSDGLPIEKALLEAKNQILQHSDKAAVARAWIGLSSVRESIMVAKSGLTVMHHEGEAERPVTAFATIGLGHRGFPNKLKVQGSKVSVKELDALLLAVEVSLKQ